MNAFRLTQYTQKVWGYSSRFPATLPGGRTEGMDHPYRPK